MSAQSSALRLDMLATRDASEAQTDDQDVKRARMRTRRQVLVQVLRIAVAVVIIGGWELSTRTDLVDPFFYGQPSGIAAQIIKWIQNGTAQGSLWEQIYVTLAETMLGFFVGVALGVLCGVLLGRNRLLADVCGPYIKGFNAMPRVVLGSIFVIALGLGMPSKVALAAVLVFFVVFFNAFQGVREVDRNLLNNARILGADERQISFSVILPSALTWIIASLHTSFGFALVGAIVGEYLGANKGIGLMIATAQGTFNANGVFAAMLILAVVAIIAESVVTWLENRLIKWRPNTITDIGL